MSDFQESCSADLNAVNMFSCKIRPKSQSLFKLTHRPFLINWQSNSIKKTERTTFFNDTRLTRKVLPNPQKPLKYRVISHINAQGESRF